MRVWKIVASVAIVLAVAVVGPVVDAWRHGGSALGLPLGIATAPGLPRPTVTVTAAPTDEPAAPPEAEPSTPPATRRPSTTPAVPPSSAGGRPPTHDASGRPILYLTFDDGPDPTWTPAVLRLLTAHRPRPRSSRWARRSRGSRRSPGACGRRATSSGTTRTRTRG